MDFSGGLTKVSPLRLEIMADENGFESNLTIAPKSLTWRGSSPLSMSEEADEQSSAMESTPLLGADAPEEIVVFRRRWYILFLASMTGTLQMLMWNTWGPISDSAELVFNWTNADVTTFADIGNVFCIIMALPASWILDVLGLRVAFLICIGTTFIATAVRCITSHATTMYWLCVVSAVIEGFGGPITLAAVGKLSATWFPAHERPVSTGIATGGIYIGIATSLLLGPQVVHYIDPSKHNDTLSSSNFTSGTCNTDDTSDKGENPIISKQRDQIMYLMYLECALSGLVLLLTLLYFPPKPPSPPSLSATTARIDFKWGIQELAKNAQFWLVMVAYGLGGAVISWCNIVAISLKNVGIDQTEAGYMGFAQTLLGFGLGIMVSIFMSKYLRHVKATIIVIYLAAGAAFVWVILLRNGYIPYSLPQLYVSVILAGAVVPTVSPLFYELACERFYPVAEGIIGGYMALVMNSVSVLLLLVFFIPNIGEDWIIPTMLTCTLLPVPLMLGIKTSYGRLDIDDHIVTATPTTDP